MFSPDFSAARNSRSDTSASRSASAGTIGSLSVRPSCRKRYSIVTASARVQVACPAQIVPPSTARPFTIPEPMDSRIDSCAQSLTGSASMNASSARNRWK